MRRGRLKPRQVTTISRFAGKDPSSSSRSQWGSAGLHSQIHPDGPGDAKVFPPQGEGQEGGQF